MKTLEINEKRQKNLGLILTKVLVSMLIIALEYQSLSLVISLEVMLGHSTHNMGRYENKFIRIFMNFDEINEKSRDNTYKITHISIDSYPRVIKLVLR